MTAWLLDILKGPLVSGGLVLLLSGAALAFARKVPLQLLAWVRRHLLVEVEVLDPGLLAQIGTFLGAQPLGRRPTRARLLHALSPVETSLPRVVLEPGIGIHWTRFEGRRLVLTLAVQAEASELRPRLERASIRYLGRDPGLAQRFFAAAVAHYARLHRGATPLFLNYWEEWKQIDVPAGRPLDSVILPGNMAAELRADIERFLSRQEWYAAFGIPWRRTYLFEGPPGGGKSSSARALCSDLKLPVYVPDLRSPGISDRTLALLFSRIPCRAAVLIEDVDCVVPDRDGKEGVSLSGLLNVLDGPFAGAGRIVVLTTNHFEKLDPALTRKGRVDVRVRLGAASFEQAKRLCLRLRPDHPDPETFARHGEGQAMADLQHALIGGEL